MAELSRSKRAVLWLLESACTLTFHAGGCWLARKRFAVEDRWLEALRG